MYFEVVPEQRLSGLANGLICSDFFGTDEESDDDEKEKIGYMQKVRSVVFSLFFKNK